MTVPLLIRSNLFCYMYLYWVTLVRKKKAKSFHFMLSLLSRSGFEQNLENVVKNFLTVISNGLGFKLFTLNQVIDEVNC